MPFCSIKEDHLNYILDAHPNFQLSILNSSREKSHFPHSVTNRETDSETKYISFANKKNHQIVFKKKKLQLIVNC